MKLFERRRTFAYKYLPVPPLSRLSDQEMDERVDVGRRTYEATVAFLRNRASAEREYAKSLRRVVTSSKIPLASEGAANTLRGIMHESAAHDAMSHEKYADMLIDRANEIEKHSKLGQTNLNESRELYVVVSISFFHIVTLCTELVFFKIQVQTCALRRRECDIQCEKSETDMDGASSR